MASQCSCSVMLFFFSMRNFPMSWYVFSICTVKKNVQYYMIAAILQFLNSNLSDSRNLRSEKKIVFKR